MRRYRRDVIENGKSQPRRGGAAHRRTLAVVASNSARIYPANHAAVEPVTYVKGYQYHEAAKRPASATRALEHRNIVEMRSRGKFSRRQAPASSALNFGRL